MLTIQIGQGSRGPGGSLRGRGLAAIIAHHHLSVSSRVSRLPLVVASEVRAQVVLAREPHCAHVTCEGFAHDRVNDLVDHALDVHARLKVHVLTASNIFRKLFFLKFIIKVDKF